MLNQFIHCHNGDRLRRNKTRSYHL